MFSCIVYGNIIVPDDKWFISNLGCNELQTEQYLDLCGQLNKGIKK